MNNYSIFVCEINKKIQLEKKRFFQDLQPIKKNIYIFIYIYFNSKYFLHIGIDLQSILKSAELKVWWYVKYKQ